MSNQERRDRCNAAATEYRDAVCALGIGDIPATPRERALRLISEAYGEIRLGCAERDRERQREEIAERLGMKEHDLRQLFVEVE